MQNRHHVHHEPFMKHIRPGRCAARNSRRHTYTAHKNSPHTTPHNSNAQAQSTQRSVHTTAHKEGPHVLAVECRRMSLPGTSQPLPYMQHTQTQSRHTTSARRSEGLHVHGAVGRRSTMDIVRHQCHISPHRRPPRRSRRQICTEHKRNRRTAPHNRALKGPSTQIPKRTRMPPTVLHATQTLLSRRQKGCTY